MSALPSPASLVSVAGNVAGNVAGKLTGGLADLTPMPSTVIHEAPQTTVRRYDLPVGSTPTGPPVLLVPPLAAPAMCFDLRRGCSLVEHLVDAGRAVYLVDYGSIAFSDRRLGLEHWIFEVLPTAIDVASTDAGAPVAIISWSLAGILSLLTVAHDPALQVASIVAVATPFDYTQVPLVAPLRPLALLTGGRILGSANRILGGAPAPLVRRAFQLSSVEKWVTKPVATVTHLDDRDFLAQLEAVDHFTANMLAYPGRTFGQLYHRFFRANDLADGEIELGGASISLAEVKVPVLVIAGEHDAIAPIAAVHHVGPLLTGSPDVELTTAPGGHLGVLTGRAARTTTWRQIDDWLDRGSKSAKVRPPRRAGHS